MLLGGADAVDPIIVEEIHNGAGATSSAFNVRFPITSFQLRMRISKQATIEFIVCCTSRLMHFFFEFSGRAQITSVLHPGRLWCLVFSVAGVNTGPSQCTSHAGK